MSLSALRRLQKEMSWWHLPGPPNHDRSVTCICSDRHFGRLCMDGVCPPKILSELWSYVIDFSDLTVLLQFWVPNQPILLYFWLLFHYHWRCLKVTNCLHLYIIGILLSSGHIEIYIFIFILKEKQVITISNDVYIIYFCILSINDLCKRVASKLFPCSFTRLQNEKWIKQKQVKITEVVFLLLFMV